MSPQIIHIAEKFELPMINQTVEVLNQHKDIVIYFRSSGGHASVMHAMLDLIDRNKDRIELIGYGELFSCGFEFFFLANCQRKLLPGTIGMYHRSSAEISINSAGRPNFIEGQAMITYLKTFETERLKMVFDAIEMTPSEISKIKKGDDVYFQPARMQEMLIRSSELRGY